MNRKANVIITVFFYLVILGSVTACGQVKDRPTPQAVLPHINQVPEPVKVGMVLPRPGQVDDYVITQATKAFEASRQKLWVDIRLIRPGELVNDAESIRYLAENNYDLIIVFGSMKRALKEVAPDYRETRFAILGEEIREDNITSVTFNIKEGAFAAGALAALLTKSNQVGIVATRDPGNLTYIKGFSEGVNEIAKKDKKPVKLKVSYTPADLPAVKEQAYAGAYAEALYEQDVDIIWPVPKIISSPVFEAAAAKGKFVLGIDENMNSLQPGLVYASTEIRVDTAVYGLMDDAAAKKLKPGVRKLGIAEGGVGLTDLQKGSALIPPEIIARMKSLQTQIKKGKIRIE